MWNLHINSKWKTLGTLLIVGLFLIGCTVQATGTVAKEEKGSVANLEFELVTPPYDSSIEKVVQQNKKKAGYQTVQKGSTTFVLIHLGQRPSAGYKVVIEKVEKLSDRILVTYSEKKPEGMAASVISYPTTVIKLSKTQLPIQVEKRN